MIPYLTATPEKTPLPISLVREEGLEKWLDGQPDNIAAWVRANDFKAKAGSHLVLPGGQGAPVGVLVGIGDGADLWSLAGLPTGLPEGVYALHEGFEAAEAGDLALGWVLGCYRFTRYRKEEKPLPTLVLPEGADMDHVRRQRNAIYLTRDLINTPTADMGPAELASATSQLAAEHDADVVTLTGEELLAYHFPMIHAVGRASHNAPRLIDLHWGDEGAPLVTLVGKGVCFDSGGLDIKPSANMLLMKKDMGGAANVLGLASMIMDAKLPVRLRVLIPAVENSVSGNAFRPGDVLTSRKGLTVEIGNTDAEGRLVLADALAFADEQEPALLIDCATLTGAARVAVGVEMAATFTPDDDLWRDIERHAGDQKDPVWRLPLWKPYRKILDSKIADINNAGSGSFAGATTAALFLQEFVEKAKSWVHFDIMAYNTEARPGRPVGGEAYAIRALYRLIEERFAR